jgi:hypothetical protein
MVAFVDEVTRTGYCRVADGEHHGEARVLDNLHDVSVRQVCDVVVVDSDDSVANLELSIVGWTIWYNFTCCRMPKKFTH